MFFDSTKKKVLVIDDDTSLQRQLRYRLEKHEGVDVLLATDGEHGLTQANKHNPHLIILDWMLPGIQGTDVLHELKLGKKTKATPVLMLTGRNKVGDIEDALDLGADAYLTKPFSLQKLGDKVSEMLNTSDSNSHW